MGDCIARLPALKYTLNNHRHVKMNVFVFDFMVELVKAAMKEQIDREQLYVWPRSNYKAVWLKCKEVGQPVIDFKAIQTSSAKPSLVEYGFLNLDFKTPPEGPDWNYIQLPAAEHKHPVPKRYGVLTTNYTAPVRKWEAKHWTAVAEWMIENDITPVLLGKKDLDFGLEADPNNHHVNSDDQKLEGALDLRDQTNLIEAHAIMANALFVAGIDNGLLHLASMSEVPTVWGFTSVAPYARLPFRQDIRGWRALTVVPDLSLKCRFCQTNQNYVAPKPGMKSEKGMGHDYKYCYYDDYKCLDDMSAAQFIDRIKQIVGYTGHGVKMGVK